MKSPLAENTTRLARRRDGFDIAGAQAIAFRYHGCNFGDGERV